MKVNKNKWTHTTWMRNEEKIVVLPISGGLFGRIRVALRALFKGKVKVYYSKE